MITKEEVLNAQSVWGEGIVTIGKAFTDKGDYVTAAKNHIETLYNYQNGQVLFKPTKTSKIQFRNDFEGALSYFVAGNANYDEDKGFAINPWTAVRFENSDIILNETSALAMGNYFFTTPEGDDVKVEYTFGYVKDSDGKLRINVHHSSVPFVG